MRPSTSLTHRIYLSALAVVTLATLVLRTLALYLCVDEIGYFETSALPVLSNVLLAIGAIGTLVYPLFLVKRDTLPTAVPASLASRLSALLAAVALGIAAILLLSTLGTTEQVAMTVLAMLALLCGVAYFATRAKGMGGSLSLLAFGIILGAILLISITYFDLFTPMNSPRKTSVHLCLLVVALYLLYELRMAVARPFPRVLLAAASLCFFLTLTMSGSNLIRALTADAAPIYLVGDLLSLVVGLCASVRVQELLFPASPLPRADLPDQADGEGSDA